MKAFQLVKNIGLLLAVTAFAFSSKSQVMMSPSKGAKGINPDTRLKLIFPDQPVLHNKGKISIYDADNNQLVDVLDLSISPGPKNTRTRFPYNSFVYDGLPDTVYTVNSPDRDSSHKYQRDRIGGATEADVYHFYPVLLDGNIATICLHRNKLSYGKRYYVLVDKGIFSFSGNQTFEIAAKNQWLFETQKERLSDSVSRIVVAYDGSADFSTVQGAIDYIPENNTRPVTVFIKNGTYEEIVNLRNRHHVTIQGEDREHTLICYANNGVFNLQDMAPDPSLAGMRHNMRAIFAAYKSSDFTIINLTLRSLGDKPAQAEALLVSGERMTVDAVNIEGSGDALQATGTIYVHNSKIQGFGDNVLGYGAVFFDSCEFVSTYGPHLWVRNTNRNHGNVLVNCTLRTIGEVETHIARAPDNHGVKYPYVEAVLINCKVEGLRPAGWGQVTASAENVHYWEYNSTNLSDGTAVDASKRHPASRQLKLPDDAKLIRDYQNPAFILDGWMPENYLR